MACWLPGITIADDSPDPRAVWLPISDASVGVLAEAMLSALDPCGETALVHGQRHAVAAQTASALAAAGSESNLTPMSTPEAVCRLAEALALDPPLVLWIILAHANHTHGGELPAPRTCAALARWLIPRAARLLDPEDAAGHRDSAESVATHSAAGDSPVGPKSPTAHRPFTELGQSDHQRWSAIVARQRALAREAEFRVESTSDFSPSEAQLLALVWDCTAWADDQGPSPTSIRRQLPDWLRRALRRGPPTAGKAAKELAPWMARLAAEFPVTEIPVAQTSATRTSAAEAAATEESSPAKRPSGGRLRSSGPKPLSPDQRIEPLAADWQRRGTLASGALAQLAARLARLECLESSFEETLEREKLEAMAEFAAGAGHEINNPLAVIAGRAQLFMRQESDPERRRVLASMNTQAMRVYEMIADMMLFARPPEPQVAPLDLSHLVDEFLEELAEVAAAQSTTLRRVGTCPPAWVMADARQCRVALRAVCDNALFALGRGGQLELEVRVGKGPSSAVPGVVSGSNFTADSGSSAESNARKKDGPTPRSGLTPNNSTAAGRFATPADSQTPMVCVIIRDDGPGISEEVRRHLFDPFYSGRGAGRGLGLGLSKCWRIVRNHGGRVEVDSPLGGGATFTIWLPGQCRAAASSGPQQALK